MSTLTTDGVHRTLKQFFPSKNDDFESDYTEELTELHDFGINTKEQLVDMLQRRADAVMEIDRSPMNDAEIQMHSDDFGKEYVENRLREGFWFAYPALLRIALELEFGKSYEEYANRRDGIVESGAAPDGGPAMPVVNSGGTEDHHR